VIWIRITSAKCITLSLQRPLFPKSPGLALPLQALRQQVRQQPRRSNGRSLLRSHRYRVCSARRRAAASQTNEANLP
jgi:hypothetical protein